MDLFNRRFTAQSMGEALGIEPKAIHNWATRGLIVGSRKSEGKGVPRTYSFFNLMEVAVAISLMEAGLRSPQDAFRAATHFAHMGGPVAGWVGEAPIDMKEMRQPALPYHPAKGFTLLLVCGEQSSIKTVGFEREKRSELETYFKLVAGLDLNLRGGDAGRGPTSFIVVNVTNVFRNVMQSFGLDYRVVLDEAYKGSITL